MSSAIEPRLNHLLTLLQNDGEGEDLVQALSQLTILINASDGNEIRRMDIVPIIHRFQSLSSARRGIGEEAINLLAAIFAHLEVSVIISKLNDAVLSALNSPQNAVCHFAAKVVERCVKDNSTRQELASESSVSPMLTRVAYLLGHEDLSIAKTCHDVLIELARRSDSQSLFFSPQFQQIFAELKEKNEIVKFRVYELMIDIAILSPDALIRIDEMGHLAQLVALLSQDDPLLVMNCTKLISDLIPSRHGLNYLENNGLFRVLLQKLDNINDDPFRNLLLPCYIKVFGELAHYSIPLFSNYLSILNVISSFFDQNDVALLNCALDTIAVIGLSTAGKQILEADSNIPKVLRSISRLAFTSVNNCALNCLAHILQINEPDPDGIATTITESWYQQIAGDSDVLSKLIKFCASPFLETRLKAMEVLRVLATSIWGQKLLASSPQFITYLFDRRTEREKSGKEAKYAIVCQLAKSSLARVSFEPETVSRMRQYQRDGPFYVDSDVAVSAERKD